MHKSIRFYLVKTLSHLKLNLIYLRYSLESVQVKIHAGDDVNMKIILQCTPNFSQKLLKFQFVWQGGFAGFLHGDVGKCSLQGRFKVFFCAREFLWLTGNQLFRHALPPGDDVSLTQSSLRWTHVKARYFH